MAVLSFSGIIHMRTKQYHLSCKNNKKTKSLQVPCNPLNNISRSYLPGKRVLPFTSQKDDKRKLDASMTVEAAIALPLFVCFGLAVLTPMQWLDTQRKIQTIAEQLCEDFSQYAYMAEEDQAYEIVYSDAAAGLWLYGSVYPYADSIRIMKSEVPNERGEIQFELEYQEKIPFFWEEINDTSMKVAAKRRCWIGLDGKLTGASADGGKAGIGNEAEGEMVYVTPNGERYHRYRDCRYLVNVCKAISVQDLETARNKSGGIFYACKQCVKGKESQDIVYITDWGVRYHNERSCASVSLYFRKVPLADVEDMGECSVCARRRDEDGGSEN